MLPVHKESMALPTSTAVQPGLAPSEWVMRWASAITRRGLVLDFACGSGRHAVWLASKGFDVFAIDLDCSRFVPVPPGVQVLEADLEQGDWPLTGRQFDGVVVTNYLFRERFEALLQCVVPGGVLIYETFAVGNELLGKPANPDFLLLPDELLARTGEGFEVLGFEQCRIERPRPAVIQRLCARRKG